jgi:hypothetical protein
MLLFRDEGRRPIALHASFAIHLDTVGGVEFSADAPGTVAQVLAQALDPQLVSVYATACCGDVNHVDVRHDRPQRGHVEAARIGALIAASILRAVGEGQPVSNPQVRVRSRRVALPAPPVIPDEVAAARAVIARNQDPQQSEKPQFLELVKAYQVLDVDQQQGRPWDVEVQVISLGAEAALVSLPGEIFVELGMTIRQGSPFRCTSIAELANGSIGYVPNRVAYPQGNYEVVSARCALGSGELLVDTALDMLRELHREAVGAR